MRAAEIVSGYSNLEYNLEAGRRGERYSHFEKLLCKLTGAEAAMAVNNNASSVLLILSSLAKGGEVIVSRGELIEIGGKFRIPDVMEQSGANLVEVGTTNKTHYEDYEEAITEETKALLKVHTSNYRIVGFTESVGIDELIPIAKEHGIPFKAIHVTEKETAQNVPAPVTTYALFRDGKFVTQGIQSDKKFLKLAGAAD